MSRWMIGNERVQVVWEDAPAPRLILLAGTAGADWVEICDLSGLALTGARLFPTQFPLPDEPPAWTVEQPDERTLRLSADWGSRSLTRTVKVDLEEARVHVTARLDLRGDELVEWFQDVWTFLAGGPLDYAWAPNLRPGDDMVIGDHVFRAPAVILLKDGRWAALLPDLDALAALKRARLTCLELDVKDRVHPVFGYGLKQYEPIHHTYYRHAPSMLSTPPAGPITFAYEIMVGAEAERPDVLRTVTAYQWRRYATPYLEKALPQTIPFRDYADYTYPSVQQVGEYVEFKIEGEVVGGFKALSHNGYFRTPQPIVWNQVWFNGLRSAYGMWHFGRRLGRKEWQQRARRVKMWTLRAPQVAGLFPAVYAYEDGEWWGSPPRLNGGRHRVHASSAAWTATWLLWWDRDLQRDRAAVEYARRLGDFLVEAQLPSGAIPAWFDLPDDGEGVPRPVETLRESAETGGAALFLGELALRTGETSYREALLRACDFLLAEVIPQMKYWDFETFWSCSWKPLGMTDPHTGILPHNNYSTYWAAHALLRAYDLTQDARYLRGSLEALDVLNLYQQLWNPPWLDLYTFGGFGVMNTDGEWNDSRQAVFAPLYLEAYRVTGEAEYFQRGVAALRASFALMAVPENKEVSPHTWGAYPVGLSPENFAHSGVNGTHGRSDFGWGAGGALAAAAWVENRYGGIYVDLARGQAFGIDGCRVTQVERQDDGLHFEVLEQLGRNRQVTLVTDDGRHQGVSLRANAATPVTVRVE